MTEIDPRPRQLLRNYARDVVETTQIIVVSDKDTVPKHTVVGVSSEAESFNIGTRGELAGHVFEALQGVLELAERRHMVTAEEIFAAVRKPFER